MKKIVIKFNEKEVVFYQRNMDVCNHWVVATIFRRVIAREKCKKNFVHFCAQKMTMFWTHFLDQNTIEIILYREQKVVTKSMFS